MFEGIKVMAQEAGRAPDALQLLVRANLEIADTPLGDDRADFAGSMEQIESDIAKTARFHHPLPPPALASPTLP